MELGVRDAYVKALCKGRIILLVYSISNNEFGNIANVILLNYALYIIRIKPNLFLNFLLILMFIQYLTVIIEFYTIIFKKFLILIVIVH